MATKKTKIGYHYTSRENYEKIRVSGLAPYLIDKAEARKIFPGGGVGIWLWKELLKGKAHWGSIVYQVSTKASSCIVLLKVKYSENTALPSGLEWTHAGIIGNFVYHKDIPSQIVLDWIAPEDIELVKEYDLDKIFA